MNRRLPRQAKSVAIQSIAAGSCIIPDDNESVVDCLEEETIDFEDEASNLLNQKMVSSHIFLLSERFNSKCLAFVQARL